MLLLLLACSSDKDVATPTDDTGDPVTDDSARVDDSAEDTGPFDEDGDGYLAKDDCDDQNIGIHPDANEFCDGVDQDCDEVIDEGAIDATIFYPDADEDGYGALENRVKVCADELEGHLSGGTGQWDCDDENPDVHPGADEVCGNGHDDDCDGLPAEGCRLEGDVTAADCVIPGTPGAHLSAADFNGDGDLDLAIDTYVLAGPLLGEMDVGASAAVLSEADSLLGADFDEDGYADLLVGVTSDGDGAGGLFHLPGPLTGSLTVTDANSRIQGTDAEGFGSALHWGEDLSDDGNEDLLVAGDESVRLFDRMRDNPETVEVADALVTSGGPGGGGFGAAIDAADMDGDGLADLVVAAPEFATDGAVWVLSGHAVWDEVQASDVGHHVEALSGVGAFGSGGLGAGEDIDGDGNADLLVADSDNGAWLFLGPIDGWRSTDGADGRFPGQASGAGLLSDLDLDGYDEVRLGRPDSSAAYVWYGPVSGVQTPADAQLTLHAENDGEGFGTVHDAADASNNGLGDVFVSAAAAREGTGAAYIFFNTAY